MQAAFVQGEPGTKVPDRNEDPRVAAVASRLRGDLQKAGFDQLEVSQIFSGEGRGQCVGVCGTFVPNRADELVVMLRRYSEAHPRGTMAWCVSRDAGRVFYWE